ncbi:hypothetical protein R9C00_02750 [Flammeovirgaceae bacterium SG7u.111]|nr:hypothetical protein [Flammeovirgaceae bacterium SG7u.132]WPO36359.1 hypothetical protein R9C00_02750 [Flammeovirgaceae bacterium SG7u.111]
MMKTRLFTFLYFSVFLIGCGQKNTSDLRIEFKDQYQETNYYGSVSILELETNELEFYHLDGGKLELNDVNTGGYVLCYFNVFKESVMYPLTVNSHVKCEIEIDLTVNYLRSYKQKEYKVDHLEEGDTLQIFGFSHLMSLEDVSEEDVIEIWKEDSSFIALVPMVESRIDSIEKRKRRDITQNVDLIRGFELQSSVISSLSDGWHKDTFYLVVSQDSVIFHLHTYDWDALSYLWSELNKV